MAAEGWRDDIVWVWWYRCGVEGGGVLVRAERKRARCVLKRMPVWERERTGADRPPTLHPSPFETTPATQGTAPPTPPSRGKCDPQSSTPPPQVIRPIDQRARSLAAHAQTQNKCRSRQFPVAASRPPAPPPPPTPCRPPHDPGAGEAVSRREARRGWMGKDGESGARTRWRVDEPDDDHTRVPSLSPPPSFPSTHGTQTPQPRAPPPACPPRPASPTRARSWTRTVP